jgi:hypothetical protein
LSKVRAAVIPAIPAPMTAVFFMAALYTDARPLGLLDCPNKANRVCGLLN